MEVIFNPNCIYYSRGFGKCNHPKMRRRFGAFRLKKLCILPDNECKLQKECLKLNKPTPSPPEKIYEGRR